MLEKSNWLSDRCDLFSRYTVTWMPRVFIFRRGLSGLFLIRSDFFFLSFFLNNGHGLL